MKIGIELRHIRLGESGGIAQFLQGLFDALFLLDSKNEYILFCTIYNRKLVENLPPHVEAISLPTHIFYQEIDRLVIEKNIDFLFRPFPVTEPLQFPLEKQIVLVPDLQHEMYPEFFSQDILRMRRLAFNKALSNAGAICTLSEAAKQSVMNHPWTHCEDIFITSPALQTHYQRVNEDQLYEEEKKNIPTMDFFLFPANLWPHKNHRRLLQAFKLFIRDYHNPIELILTGHPAGWKELKKEFPNLPVRHLGFVSPRLLNILMQRAQALVFFSLFEGFGMPLLEAFNVQTPVLCSNVTSLPEIGRDAVLACNPTNVKEMSQLMQRIATDKILRDTLISKGQEQLSRYTWEQAAENLLAGFKRLAEKVISQTKLAYQPLVTIVTPSYNQGRYIQRTIESVLNQTYPHIQYIVMDGNSTDETINILKSYGQRFEWISESDRGQTHAINKGFQRAKGTIFAYLNSDDILMPDTVEKIVTYFAEHPECDLVYGNADYIDEADQVIGTYNTADYSFERIMEDCCICQPATFWRKRIAECVGSFNEKLNYVMDYEYWLRIDRAGGNLHFFQEKLAASRLHSDTKTLSARGKIYHELFKVCKEYGGYVDFNYYVGRWHYWLKEGPLSKFLSKMEFSAEKFARLYYNWRYVFKKNKRFLNKKVQKKVEGFWGDNWFEADTTIRIMTTSEKQWWIEGTVPIATKLTVLYDNQEGYVFPLEPGRWEKISFESRKNIKQVTLQFSDYVNDEAGRKLAFYVQATNLFNEQSLQ